MYISDRCFYAEKYIRIPLKEAKKKHEIVNWIAETFKVFTEELEEDIELIILHKDFEVDIVIACWSCNWPSTNIVIGALAIMNKASLLSTNENDVFNYVKLKELRSDDHPDMILIDVRDVKASIVLALTKDKRWLKATDQIKLISRGREVNPVNYDLIKKEGEKLLNYDYNKFGVFRELVLWEMVREDISTSQAIEIVKQKAKDKEIDLLGGQ